jgi:hypothetical protein
MTAALKKVTGKGPARVLPAVAQPLSEMCDNRRELTSEAMCSSTVSIVNGYGLDNWGSIPGRGKDRNFSLLTCPDQL